MCTMAPCTHGLLPSRCSWNKLEGLPSHCCLFRGALKTPLFSFFSALYSSSILLASGQVMFSGLPESDHWQNCGADSSIVVSMHNTHAFAIQTLTILYTIQYKIVQHYAIFNYTVQYQRVLYGIVMHITQYNNNTIVQNIVQHITLCCVLLQFICNYTSVQYNIIYNFEYNTILLVIVL